MAQVYKKISSEEIVLTITSHCPRQVIKLRDEGGAAVPVAAVLRAWRHPAGRGPQ